MTTPSPLALPDITLTASDDAVAAPSARRLRAQWRASEASQARLRLLLDAADALATDEDGALNRVLQAAAAFIAVEHGCVFVEDAGVVIVQASVGEAPPRGTRLPAQGVLAALLAPPARALIRSDIDSRLLGSGRRRAGFELLLPLVHGGRISGGLALISRQPLPAPAGDDLRSLQALGTLLAASLQAMTPSATDTARSPADDAALALLTAREREVFALLPQGLTNAGIGARLGISAGTAKVHVERILHKLGLPDRTQAAVRAAMLGLSARTALVSP